MDVAVIGAGQAGLAAAYRLRDLGSRLVVLDAGTGPGGAWRERWASLTLGRTHRLADLPGMREASLTFADAPPSVPARDVVSEVYGAYERHWRLPVVRPVRVESVRRDGEWFVVHAAPGAPVSCIEARVIISATGTWRRPRTPDLEGSQLFQGIQVSTPEYPGVSAFAGLRVAVIGGGMSAIGFLDELAGTAAHLRWYTRRPPVWASAEGDLGHQLGRQAVALQDAAARAGDVLPSIVSVTGVPATPPVRRLRAAGLLDARPMPAALDATGAIHADGSHEALDAIIWAIGFEPDLAHLKPLGVGAHPRVIDGRVADQPGLLLAGYGGQASTISSARAARATERHVRAYLSDGSWT